jgi:anti-anti-sigma regulatory factor
MAKFNHLLSEFVTRKLSRHLMIVVISFALLPFGVTIAIGLIGASRGFEFARDFLLADKFEAEKGALSNYLHLQRERIEERFSDMAFDLRLIAKEAAAMLTHPEAYPSPETPIFPGFDRTTGMWLTPKKAEFSLRIPAGVSMTEELRRRILALDYVLPQLKLVHERFDLLSTGVSIFGSDFDLVYPWHDFKVGVSQGLMRPDTVTFQDWEYAPIVKKLPEGGVYVTPHYQDLWGAGSILSACTPIVSRKGEALAIACIDLDEHKLLSIITPYRSYEVNVLMIDGQKHAIGSMKPIKGPEKAILRKVIGETDFTNVANGHRETPDTIIMWSHDRLSGLTLIGVADKKAIALAVNPLNEKFRFIQRFSQGSGLVLMLVLLGAIAYAGQGVRKGLKKTLDAFIEPLQKVTLGETGARIVYSGYEELEFIAGTINLTFDALKQGRAELEKSQRDLEEQNRQLKEFVETIEAQRSTIEQLSTPVIPVIRQTVLVPVVGLFDSMRAYQLSEKLLETVKKDRIKHVVFDMAGCGVVDTHTLKALTDVMRAVRILGGWVHVAGFQPHVVKSLVGLGIELKDIIIEATLDQALLKIQRSQGVLPD